MTKMYRMAGHAHTPKRHYAIKIEQKVYRGHADEHFAGTTAPSNRTHSILIILHIVARYTILVQRLRKIPLPENITRKFKRKKLF